MKLCLGLFFALLAAGCTDKPAKNETASTNAGSSPLTAPVDYLGAVAKARQNAGKVADTASLNRAIQMFGVEKGRNPKDLNELVEAHIIPRIPDAPYGTKLVYDAQAGKVTVEKQ